MSVGIARRVSRWWYVLTGAFALTYLAIDVGGVPAGAVTRQVSLFAAQILNPSSVFAYVILEYLQLILNDRL
jgi:hypothetical protein